MRELTPERETRLIAAGRGRLSRAFPAPLPACDAKGSLFRTIGPGTGPHYPHGAAPDERLRDDPPTRGRGRHRNQARQSQFPGDRDHGLPQERRHARKGRGDGKPCLDPHDAAL